MTHSFNVTVYTHNTNILDWSALVNIINDHEEGGKALVLLAEDAVGTRFFDCEMWLLNVCDSFFKTFSSVWELSSIYKTKQH